MHAESLDVPHVSCHAPDVGGCHVAMDQHVPEIDRLWNTIIPLKIFGWHDAVPEEVLHAAQRVLMAFMPDASMADESEKLSWVGATFDRHLASDRVVVQVHGDLLLEQCCFLIASLNSDAVSGKACFV